jgi:ABC-2 type transport system permease protein
MNAIFRKEFKSYFHSFIGWLYLAIAIACTGIYSANDNFKYGSNSLKDVMSGISFLILITVPIISMKIISEDRRNKTDQLMLTAPVSLWDIVIGKYLAMVAIFAIPCAMAAMIPVILMSYGTIDIAGSYISLLGYFLMGCMALAIGELISALTENIVLSALFTFLALFLCFIMQGICYMISASGNIFTKILGIFDIQSRFTSLSDSSLDFRAIVYFVTCIDTASVPYGTGDTEETLYDLCRRYKDRLLQRGNGRSVYRAYGCSQSSVRRTPFKIHGHRLYIE